MGGAHHGQDWPNGAASLAGTRTEPPLVPNRADDHTGLATVQCHLIQTKTSFIQHRNSGQREGVLGSLVSRGVRMPTRLPKSNATWRLDQLDVYINIRLNKSKFIPYHNLQHKYTDAPLWRTARIKVDLECITRRGRFLEEWARRGPPLEPHLPLAEHLTLTFGPTYYIKINVNAMNLVPKTCSCQQEDRPLAAKAWSEASHRLPCPAEATRPGRRFLSRDKRTPDRMADSNKTRNGTQNNTEKYFIRKFRDS